MAKKNKSCVRKTSIGGQAVLEGVMMRGPSCMATAVRNPEGDIVIESSRFTPAKDKNFLYRAPIIRGVISFFSSMILGVKTLMSSAAVYGDVEAEPSKFEKWLAEKTKFDIMDIAGVIGLVLGLALSILLFFFLPNLIATAISKIAPAIYESTIWYNLIEGGIRIIIFILYIVLVSFMKDIKRTFMYHGAEHKTITCYESGEELTVENVRTKSRQHDRCGTTFMFLVMIIAILLFSVVDYFIYDVIGWERNVFLRFGIRLLILPLVAGVSYEFLKLFAKSNNILFRIFKAPGLWLQKLTTKEPTDDMLEVAITAFNTVMKMEEDKSIPCVKFEKRFINIKNEYEKKFTDSKLELSSFEWIVAFVKKISRSQVALVKTVTDEEEKLIKAYSDRVLAGEPLQYVLGSTEFYGIQIKCDKRALIPRLDTECVVDEAVKIAKKYELKNALDLCCGSGAIAIALAQNTTMTVSASDKSNDALKLAEENAKLLNADIKFYLSDMFMDIEGKYDMIISNPPYIATEIIKTLDNEVKAEPFMALDGGLDGLDFYRVIAQNASTYINENGFVILEIGYDQAEAVVKLMSESFSRVQVIKDLSGNDRTIVATNREL